MVTNRDRKSFVSRQKKIKFAQTTGTVEFFDPLSDISDPFRGELPHIQVFLKDIPKPFA